VTICRIGEWIAVRVNDHQGEDVEVWVFLEMGFVRIFAEEVAPSQSTLLTRAIDLGHDVLVRFRVQLSHEYHEGVVSVVGVEDCVL
jgi:hypothetical protein